MLIRQKKEAVRDAEQAIQLDPKLSYSYIARGAARTSLRAQYWTKSLKC
jgi:hypothetical protein